MMTTTTRSFLTAQREASKLVSRAEKLSVRIPMAGKVAVPPPDQLAFFAALGLLTAVGLLDWPVVLAAGVGQVVVARHLEGRRIEAAEEPAHEDQTATLAPSGPVTANSAAGTSVSDETAKP